jgi:ribosomal protein L18E
LKRLENSRVNRAPISLSRLSKYTARKEFQEAEKKYYYNFKI